MLRSNGPSAEAAAYRDVVEAYLKSIGARFEATDVEMRAFPHRDDVEERISFGSETLKTEARDDGNSWRTLHEWAYQEAWEGIHRARRWKAIRVIGGVVVWALLAVPPSIWLWGRFYGWLGLVLRFGPVAIGLLLWVRHIPFREPYPELFLACAIASINSTLGHERFAFDWGLPLWIALTAVFVFLALRSGGLALIPYLGDHLTSNPGRVAEALRESR